MTDYRREVLKFVNAGLNVAVPPDLIGPGKYTRLTNVRTLQEGALTTRFGLRVLGYSSGEISDEVFGAIADYPIFMTRLTVDKILCVQKSGAVLLLGAEGFREVLAYNDIEGVGNPRGTIAREPLNVMGVGVESQDGSTALGVSVSLNEFSVVKFTSKISGEDWAFLGSKWGMWKIDGDGYAWKWGIRPPLQVTDSDNDGEYEFTAVPLQVADREYPCPTDDAGATDCGLDNTSVIAQPYAWVYTYYNSKTDTESNPCDEMELALDNFTSKPGGGELAVKLTGFRFPTDPQVDRYRVYRRGGFLADYVLEDEIPVIEAGMAVDHYISYKYDDAIAGNQLLNENNAVPFTSVESAYDNPDPYGAVSTDPELEEPGISSPKSLYETPLPTVWGPFAGSYIFGTGDERRPGVVYWTNAGSPDTSGFLNEVQVSASAKPIIAGFVYGGNSYVFTKDNLYALDWGGPTSQVEFTPREVPLGQGLSAPNALCVASAGVFFLSKDGIYATDCTSTTKCITKDSLRPIFLGLVAGQYEGAPNGGDAEFQPIDWNRSNEISLEAVGQEIHFLYWSTAGERIHLVYDILHDRWQRFTTVGTVAAVYGDENQSRFRMLVSSYTSEGGAVLVMEDAVVGDAPLDPSLPESASTSIPVQIRTAAIDRGEPLTEKQWGVLMVDADTEGTPVTISAIYDNYVGSVAGGDPPDTFLLQTSKRETKTFSLGDVYSKNITLDFAWSGSATIYQVVLQHRLDEELITHWEHPYDSLGMRGWKHLRDGYLMLNSTATVTLRVEIDQTQSFTIEVPSTDGELKACYVKFPPTKGKLYRFSLDCAEPFKLYVDDTYVNVKLWQTGNSYSALKLGGEGVNVLQT